MKNILEIFRDGNGTRSYLTIPLDEGREGNLQTLEAMAEMVRCQRTQPDLRAFVEQQIVGDVPGHDFEDEVHKCFEFAQKQITYRRDPFGVERVADIWSTLYAPALMAHGDCGIKSCFFAATVALMGHKPFFTVIAETPNAKSFAHVYAGVMVDGTARYFDPTPEDKPAGWEEKIPGSQKFMYPIF